MECRQRTPTSLHLPSKSKCGRLARSELSGGAELMVLRGLKVSSIIFSRVGDSKRSDTYSGTV